MPKLEHNPFSNTPFRHSKKELHRQRQKKVQAQQSPNWSSRCGGGQVIKNGCNEGLPEVFYRTVQRRRVPLEFIIVHANGKLYRATVQLGISDDGKRAWAVAIPNNGGTWCVPQREVAAWAIAED
jgi:hypothetical protein